MIVGDIEERGHRRMRGYVTRDNNTMWRGRYCTIYNALSVTHDGTHLVQHASAINRD